tara:strand:+ start:625 stop:756 length:132 start_codon:yes stop_codon:yes gene_type:complete
MVGVVGVLTLVSLSLNKVIPLLYGEGVEEIHIRRAYSYAYSND